MSNAKSGVAIAAVMSAAPKGVGVLKHIFRVGAFISVAIILYHPFGTHWINNPSPSWDANRTADSWQTDGWSWDVVDIIYFAMVTMTTVGYGDMPTLRQEIRICTIFFGFIGVVSVSYTHLTLPTILLV